ncbi:MAG: HEAT repeat domain-containing protein [Symploca sp. SIO2G7]|nr:HEAT repeat domain-containing protein [Symploca sp. SIO2G7]
MFSKYWKSRAPILIALGMLLAITLPVLGNIKTLAQTPSATFQCTEVELQKHIQQLDEGEPAAFDALVECNSQAVPVLIRTLGKTQNEEVRIIIIAALGEIGPQAAPAIPVLNELLQEPSRDVRIVLVHSLGQMGQEAVPALIRALDDPDRGVRSNTAETIGKIGTEAKAAIPALTAALQDEDEDTTLNAAVAIFKVGGNPEDTIPVLIANLQGNPCDWNFELATQTLGEIGGKAVPALTTALEDTNENIRLWSAHTLSQIGADAKDAVPELTEVFLDSYEYTKVRYEAIQALENIASYEAISVLDKYRETADAILQEEKVVFICHTSRTNMVRLATTNHIKRQPVMCRIQVIKSILGWKCS